MAPKGTFPREIPCSICGNPYTQTRTRNTAHKECSARQNGGQSVEQPAKPQTLDAAREAMRDRAQTVAWRDELKRLLSAEESRRVYLQTIRDCVPLLEVPQQDLRRGLDGDRPKHTWLIMLSDWHIGQKTESTETGGLFEQSVELAREQIRDLWRTIELLYNIYAPSLDVERIILWQGGDLIEGSGMRPSQARKIQVTATKQAIEANDLLAWLVQQCLALVPHVSIWNVPGNHDRVSPKAGDGGLGELGYHDTYSWLIAEIERRQFARAIGAGRLDLTNHESFFGGQIVANQKIVYEHGASFQTSSGSYGGIGWYPIQAAGMRYQQMLEGADLVMMGHFHTPAVLPLGRGWQVINGSLVPSTTWVQSSFKKVTTPIQWMLDLHPKFGLVGARPLYLSHAGIALPGAYWRRLEEEAKRAA